MAMGVFPSNTIDHRWPEPYQWKWEIQVSRPANLSKSLEKIPEQTRPLGPLVQRRGPERGMRRLGRVSIDRALRSCLLLAAGARARVT